jgi:UDP-galactopyranose mutase
LAGYDTIIVGAGFFGATCAHELARRGQRVLVLDKRSHIGGNCYTEPVEGIPVHRYGAHIFHTNDERIWRYVNGFAHFRQYCHRVKVSHGGRLLSFPINLMTLHQLWGVSTPEEAERRFEEQRVPIENPRNMEEWCLATIGPDLYETFIRGYTAKQWGREPKDLPASIVRRIPVRLNFDDSYFDDRFVGIPEEGYTPIFERMLEGIEVRTGCDFFEDRDTFERLGRVIFTGMIDAYFDYRFGPLEYRSLRFESEVVEGDFQGCAVVNYTERDVPFTRILEHKHFHGVHSPKSVITREYPDAYEIGREPYYPIADEANKVRYEQYREIPTDTIFGGRCGRYVYWDMHQAIGAALTLVDKLAGSRRPMELAA